MINKFEGIIDVRTKEEYNQEHIEGAINIDMYAPDFENNIKSLDPAKSYLVYCASGGRSSQVSMFMHSNGFTKVENLNGGISSLV